jgi:1-acyl-sn-glycerol-3-phosphate acyltransferase
VDARLDARLDGIGAPLAPAAPGPRVLGRDPFLPGPDPFLERLEEVLGGAAQSRPDAAAPPRETRRSPAPGPEPRSASRAEPREDAPASWAWERLLGEDPRRRLAAFERRVRAAGADPWGLEPSAVRRALPLFLGLYRGWFRVKSAGHEHVPAEGPAVLAANHAGLLPFDGAMTAVDLFLHGDPPRLARALVDRWASELPWVGDALARLGQTAATRSNVAGLLGDRQLVLVFPEGMEGIKKPVTQRYRLQRFHSGFVEEALRAGAPIVPTAILGSENQAPILFDVKPVARLLRLPTAPVTPTFPWLGPLGLLPYPVSYRIVYGAPLDFARYGPEDADDARLVRYLTQRVRRAVQRLVDRERG